MRTRLYHHPIFAEHLTGPGHPERPERMQAVTAALEDEAFQHLDRAEAPEGALEGHIGNFQVITEDDVVPSGRWVFVSLRYDGVSLVLASDGVERRSDVLQSLGRKLGDRAAPVVPALNDMEIERILDAAKARGVREAGYVLLRLPLEVSDLFRQWLQEHYPDRFEHVMSVLREMRGGQDYDAEWGKRMRGIGPYAWQIGRRFELAANRLKLNRERLQLRTDLFKPPGVPSQLQLL